MVRFKLAVCQMCVTENKKENILKALNFIEKAADNKAEMIVLPEMFNCPYDNSKFAEYSEDPGNSETLKSIAAAAKSLGVYIAAGSIPENSGGSLYNTSFIFDKHGEIIGKHRKVHLFDLDVPGKIKFKESDTLTAGSQITVVDTEFCKIGVAICYDMRFPELIRAMTVMGAKLIILPAAFNMVTGPAHWEPLLRIRAIDNQVYVAAASPARNESANYIAYGNSMIVDPWGDAVSRACEKEEIIYGEIDMGKLLKIRNELPLLRHRRTDLYNVEIHRGT